jgi:dipeptidyl aminopeptidase/acylaminoacyl peptidase
MPARAVRLPLAALILVAAPGPPPGAAPAPEGTGSGPPGIRQFLGIRTPANPDLLPDGALLVRDWPDGLWQLYRVRPGAAGSYAPGEATTEKLTDYPDGLARFSASPDGRWVVLMHARAGDENTQLTLLDLADPARRVPVLADPRVRASADVWLRHGSGFLYSANATSPNDFHVYRYDIGTGKTTPLVAREGSWSAHDVTDDGRRALVERRVSASETHCYELDVRTGRLTEITLAPPGGTAACDVVGYLPGEKQALLASDMEGGLRRLYVRDLASGRHRAAVPALEAHELGTARLNDRRDLLAVATNEDGYGVLRAFRLPGFEPVALPAIERGLAAPASFRGTRLVWTLNNARAPGTAQAADLAAERPAARTLTWTATQGVDLGGFPLPELIRYPTFDGREIPAFLFRPPGHEPGRPIPFVVHYHGGPEGQHRPTFNAVNQYLLSRGFGILMPNVRGSTGYGREYQMLDDYRRRWDSVRDGVAAAAWLVRSGHASPGRIATYGGSYGGFMSVACVVEDQEAVERGERAARLFGACVSTVGIVNLKTFLERTSGYRRKLREAEYGPLSDPEFLASVSSLHRADKIQVPVLIGHGFNDPRVPVEEAMQLAAALRARGGQVRLFIAPDEGHGFAKLDSRIYYNERVAAFLEETLKGETPARAAAGEPVD